MAIISEVVAKYRMQKTIHRNHLKLRMKAETEKYIDNL